MLLSSVESFVGSIWFGVALFAFGYVAGHVLSITNLRAIVARLFGP